MTRQLKKPQSKRPAFGQFDWNFSDGKVEDWEVLACCHYEFARESPTIVAHYDEGRPLDLNLGLTYRAAVNGKTIALVNPFQWPWPPALGPFAEGCYFADTPWRGLPEEYRKVVVALFQTTRGLALDSAFRPADSQFMKQHVISRGGEREGIDREKGIERIAVEIDWAAFDDREIYKAFKKWIGPNRPENIGFSDHRGKRITDSLRAKLDRLAIMRLYHHSTLNELPERFPDAWEWLRARREWAAPFNTPADLHKSGRARDMIGRLREGAGDDFRQLFPFLPPAETPRSWIPFFEWQNLPHLSPKPGETEAKSERISPDSTKNTSKTFLC